MKQFHPDRSAKLGAFDRHPAPCAPAVSLRILGGGRPAGGTGAAAGVAATALRMLRHALLVCFPFCTVPVCVCQQEPPPVPSGEAPALFDIQLRDGKQYMRCKSARVLPDGILLSHEGGMARIPFEKLPDEYQRKYGYDPVKVAAYRAQVAAERARVAAEKAVREWRASVKPFQGELKVGGTGVFGEKIRVLQVLGPSDMLVEVPVKVKSQSYETRTMVVSSGGGGGVVMGNVSVPVEREVTKRTTVYMRGIPTDGLVDDATVSRNEVFQVTSTGTYQSALGPRTVFVLEPARPPMMR
jgi:hypothetical protein